MSATLHRGGCHCGRVRFEAVGEIDRVVECNCSICRQKGYLHWYLTEDRFRLLQGAEALTPYRFNTGRAEHYFCKTCGVAPFYRPRSHPDMIDVNLRCIDALDLDTLEVEPFDGRNWEQEESQLADLAPPRPPPEPEPEPRALPAPQPDDLRLEHLVDVPETLPQLATWHFAEWGHHGNRTPESMAERLRGHLNRESLPLTLVAFAGARVVGTAALVETDMDTRLDLTPWLADVVVDPELRGQQIGSRVVESTVSRARDLGVKTLYLFTPDRETFYARMGWRVRERVEYRGEDVVVMEIDIGSEG